MPINSAAVLPAHHADFIVQPARYTPPGPHELVVRNRAVAVNPLDAIKQSTGDLMFRWLPYPSVLGEDVAGEVVEVGSDVTRFRVGDRVVAYAVGMEKERNHESEGAFQLFTVVSDQLAAPIPASLSFVEAAVLPLAISTAASALFQDDQLGLRHPVGSATGVSAAPLAEGATVVVWGGSTSVGSNAVQLAVAAGYRVISTASPRNHERVRHLGASDVFDYASPTVVRDIAALLAGIPVAGVLAVGTGSAEPAVAIAVATGAKRVALASPSVSLESLPRRRGLSLALVKSGLGLVGGNTALQARCRVHGIRARFVWGSSLMNNEVGPMLWERFLPAALAEGRYAAAPEPRVIGEGLDQVQVAIDTLRRGVSAQKLVVML
ncbi:zinc-binding alcohol dehydrogenase family protein [Subtercola boreus]|uniref:Zn-dependent oxidoreductase n=1 Tax=Subtercola boreus TaxID=120213 RepID=A0A3E0WB14_9MICO|nr:zinc-binding alcohol dehydrogenase family protein [Subtercola boreus]RFA18992.1 Zn-dependent oxidoreductase [Subtercola boreus]RFA19119.1 Zn-dependent oxidoreductase [Subtercola boreus]RFA25718.1 Zn-dependent oxidoreductase [Subtercola boreus]